MVALSAKQFVLSLPINPPQPSSYMSVTHCIFGILRHQSLSACTTRLTFHAHWITEDANMGAPLRLHSVHCLRPCNRLDRHATCYHSNSPTLLCDRYRNTMITTFPNNDNNSADRYQFSISNYLQLTPFASFSRVLSLVQCRLSDFCNPPGLQQPKVLGAQRGWNLIPW